MCTLSVLYTLLRFGAGLQILFTTLYYVPVDSHHHYIPQCLLSLMIRILGLSDCTR